jgi:HEAT repeat protein
VTTLAAVLTPPAARVPFREAEQLRRLAQSEPVPRWIIVAAEPITDVDTTAADMLEELDQWPARHLILFGGCQ